MGLGVSRGPISAKEHDLNDQRHPRMWKEEGDSM